MHTVVLKLRLNKAQEATLEAWLVNLTAMWNWAIRKIELDTRYGVYHSKYDFMAFLNGHSVKLDIPCDVLMEMAKTAYTSWERCFKKISRRPRFKGNRNQLNSIPFRKDLKLKDQTHIKIYKLGVLKFHKQRIPEGKIKTGRIIKRASGWYLALGIEAEIAPITPTGDGIIGIDPGYSTHLTTSDGQKIFQPDFKQHRLIKAQRGHNKHLSARVNERIKNRRKDNAHKVSTMLVARNKTIYFSKDNIGLLKKRFGKSASNAGHYELRSMLAYKCSHSSRRYVEVPSKKSTMTCSSCGALTGPKGLGGLSVRFWSCACGAIHDRDINAAMNALKTGLGMSHDVETVYTESNENGKQEYV